MKDILVPISRFDPWPRSAQVAAELAKAFGGHLTGVAISQPYVAVESPEVALASAALIELSAEQQRRAEAAGPEFRAWAGQRGLADADWQVAEGFVADVLAYAANWHDLLVLGRDNESPWGRVEGLGPILMSVGLPCLVLPEDRDMPLPPQTVAVAWNGSPESIRALHSALPLLRNAERIVILRGHRREPFLGPTRPCTLDLDAYFSHNDLSVETHDLDPEREHHGEVVLEAAQICGAELLVMGAYGRSRFSEWVLGGATRHALQHSPLPLWMRH